MNTEASAPHGTDHKHPHPLPKPSPLRLMILLGVLTLFAGALIYDWVIAPPRVKAANDKLHEVALKHNEFSLTSVGKREGIEVGAGANGGLLYSADIQNIMGMAPTKVEKHDLYTIEHYCWWGWVPRNRNYITVLYIGAPDKPHYSTHYANELPEDGAIPGKVKPAEAAGPATLPESPGDDSPAPRMPAMAPPGMKLSPGDPGKGRPQGKGGKAGGEPKGGADGDEKVDDAKGSDDSKKADEPAKRAEPKKESADKEGAKPEPGKETAKDDQ